MENFEGKEEQKPPHCTICEGFHWTNKPCFVQVLHDDPAKMEPLEAYRFGYAVAERNVTQRYEESLRAERWRTEEFSKRCNQMAEELAKGFMLQPAPVIYVKQVECAVCGSKEVGMMLKPERII